MGNEDSTEGKRLLKREISRLTTDSAIVMISEMGVVYGNLPIPRSSLALPSTCALAYITR